MAEQSLSKDVVTEDGDVLFRRIPVNIGAYNENGLTKQAFRPGKYDSNGISLSHSRLGRTSYDEGRDGRKGKKYYVAVIDRRILEFNGVQIEPRPEPGNPSHVELPQIRADNAKSDEAELVKTHLQNATIRVDGPFDGERVVD